MIFELPELPFSMNALEPVVSRLTMDVHYCQLHAGYVKRLNEIVEARPELHGMGLIELLEVSEPGSPLAHNAGGHFNHSFLWSTLAPPYQGGTCGPMMGHLIGESFGPFSSFKKTFDYRIGFETGSPCCALTAGSMRISSTTSRGRWNTQGAGGRSSTGRALSKPWLKPSPDSASAVALLSVE